MDLRGYKGSECLPAGDHRLSLVAAAWVQPPSPANHDAQDPCQGRHRGWGQSSNYRVSSDLEPPKRLDSDLCRLHPSTHR